MADEGADNQPSPGQKISIRISKQELRSILEFDHSVTQANGIQLLTPEGRVLLRLALDGAMSVSGAQNIAGTSYSSYYAVLRRLKAAGLITAAADKADGRVKWLRIKQDK